MTKNERLFFNFATHCRNCIVKQAGFKGGFQIRINRPVKSLFPRCRVKALGHNYARQALPCLEKKFNFTGCAAVLTELFFVKTKQQISGNTLCITGDFCEVWAEKSRSKPFSPYLNPPKWPVGFMHPGA